MRLEHISPADDLSLFVKDIIVFEEHDEFGKASLPFYADGYPGLMFQDTANGLFVMPHQKQMPALFLYGQTLQPIELMIEGRYQLVVFQLYPFVLKNFFHVTPKDINDDCYDLLRFRTEMITDMIARLQQCKHTSDRILILSSFLRLVFEESQQQLDFKIRQAIQTIIENKGQVQIARLCEQLKISERTFERRFAAQTGISPKQFASIIQFDASLNQLNAKSFSKLTDIVYANGFADQSHFIRVFKAFTGTTPKKFTAS